MSERNQSSPSGCSVALFVVFVALFMAVVVTTPRFRRLEDRVKALEAALAVIDSERKDRE